MSTFVNILAIVVIAITLIFVISIGAPFYILVLIVLGLGGPLLCSLGAVLGKGE